MKFNKKFLIGSGLLPLVLCLVAWSPPGEDNNQSLIAGSGNSVEANNSLVTGLNNDIHPISDTARNSCLIGGNNQVITNHGYAIGYNNTITGNYGATLGYGLNVTPTNGVAIGKWNKDMFTNDVFVVGAGSADNDRDTALRVTNDSSMVLGSTSGGKVTLAKPQGDISMGVYTN
jgi:hypothetical protein